MTYTYTYILHKQKQQKTTKKSIVFKHSLIQRAEVPITLFVFKNMRCSGIEKPTKYRGMIFKSWTFTPKIWTHCFCIQMCIRFLFLLHWVFEIRILIWQPTVYHLYLYLQNLWVFCLLFSYGDWLSMRKVNLVGLCHKSISWNVTSESVLIVEDFLPMRGEDRKTSRSGLWQSWTALLNSGL